MDQAARTNHYENYCDSGVQWMGDVPLHWSLTRLKFVTRCLDGKRIPLNGTEREKRKGDIPYWGANKVVDFVNDYIFDQELVLLGEDGAPFFDDSKPVAFYVKGKIWPNNHIHVLKALDISSKFLTYQLNIVDYVDYIDGSTRDKLTQGKMVNIPIVQPSLSEQDCITNFLDQKSTEIDEAIAKKQRLVELLKEQRTILINQAVTKGLYSGVSMRESGVEWIGLIPEHWELKKVKHIFRLIIEPAEKNNDHELLSVYTDIGVRPRKDLEDRGNKASTTDGYWLVNKGDIIVNKLLAWMGAIGLSNYDGVTSPAYDILRPVIDYL